MLSETARVLYRAALLIENGWSKYKPARNWYRQPTDLMGDQVHSVSMDGAIRLSLSSLRLKNRPRTERLILARLSEALWTRVPHWEMIERQLSAELGPMRNQPLERERALAYLRLEAYNDSVAKTKKDVVAVLDQVSAALTLRTKNIGPEAMGLASSLHRGDALLEPLAPVGRVLNKEAVIRGGKAGLAKGGKAAKKRAKAHKVVKAYLGS